MGPNGSGKTTLLNVIQGTTLPDSGSVRLGANVELASVEQNPGGLNLSPVDICGSDTAARTLLACLKLRPDRLNRPLHELSGGERTKVALARILASGANLLLLDEPTNHLEIEAQEALEHGPSTLSWRCQRCVTRPFLSRCTWPRSGIFAAEPCA